MGGGVVVAFLVFAIIIVLQLNNIARLLEKLNKK